MGRYSSNNSYRHAIKRFGPDDFRLFWTVDFYYHDTRGRFPRGFSRDTNRKGAERFAKRWKISMPTE